ncbi:serine/threonine-protein phosphatase [Pantoea sp. Bo_2]|uniref:Serine/threonine-protein phosphatase n=1 Tax=Candidatus Pantoea gossypiicola TaxID=2608008 RepID=A0AB34CDI5_9GAMM|nr:MULTISPECIES: metallophosphoesterase [Pantoea]KAA5923990.1 serine/threonine-protein phosphatase [Pantoea sp. VH_8]KAA5930493.1 serine/threonine-protein phosphatase [Pantoea sp. VH_4]KAA5940487.1 serine/threonine-protein phosphatase [Pantoea sp. VH_3]KAA5949633.1 serine/threonine-protein phosphatase [Pantoea sp. VH_25]KAA5955361.1 serine/threonine-protein phosphatase [Pantoea sp. VH_24]
MYYHVLNGAEWRRIWVVGDIHGCRRELDALLQQHQFNPQQDLLISVGDIIDRGPDSLGCLVLLDEPWFRCVRGNHEEMALSALQGQDMALWRMNGGDWFFRLRSAALIVARHALRRCGELPLILHLQLGERTVVIAHADYPAREYALNKPLDWQKVVWSRQRLEGMASGEQAGIRGADAFYFGHTPLKQPLTIANLHYIDTGAVFGNHLTMLQLK